jgi:membrane fusion protein (multidrug efflux system)
VIESHPAKNGGKPEAVVSQKFVRTGRSHGDFISILTGLKSGDRVVSAGVFKLRNGMSVQENNETTPKPSNSPKPGDS